MTDPGVVKKYSCPSSRAKPGSSLLGIRGEDGTVHILPKPLPVDEDFMKAVHQDPVPAEQRFRFVNKCIEGGCKQWNGHGCGIADRIVHFLDKVPVVHLPECDVRPTCRWFAQHQENACKVCTYIITEITEEEVEGAAPARAGALPPG